jgi:hypothetical protein
MNNAEKPPFLCIDCPAKSADVLMDNCGAVSPALTLELDTHRNSTNTATNMPGAKPLGKSHRSIHTNLLKITSNKLPMKLKVKNSEGLNGNLLKQYLQNLSKTKSNGAAFTSHSRHCNGGAVITRQRCQGITWPTGCTTSNSRAQVISKFE